MADNFKNFNGWYRLQLHFEDFPEHTKLFNIYFTDVDTLTYYLTKLHDTFTSLDPKYYNSSSQPLAVSAMGEVPEGIKIFYKRSKDNLLPVAPVYSNYWTKRYVIHIWKPGFKTKPTFENVSFDLSNLQKTSISNYSRLTECIKYILYPMLNLLMLTFTNFPSSNLAHCKHIIYHIRVGERHTFPVEENCVNLPLVTTIKGDTQPWYSLLSIIKQFLIDY